MTQLDRFDGMTVDELRDRMKTTTTPETRFRAMVGLCALLDQEAAHADLLEAMGDADASLVAYACKQVARRSSVFSEEQAAELKGRLEACLQHEDPDVKFEAARAWVHFPFDSRVVHRLLHELLNDPETQPLMLGPVLKTFAKAHGPVDQLEVSFKLLADHEKEDLREAVAESIGLLGSEGRPFASILLKLLDDEDPFVRERAAHSLALIGSQAAEIVEALKAATQDEDEGCAEEARKSLEQLLK